MYSYIIFLLDKKQIYFDENHIYNKMYVICYEIFNLPLIINMVLEKI